LGEIQLNRNIYNEKNSELLVRPFGTKGSSEIPAEGGRESEEPEITFKKKNPPSKHVKFIQRTSTTLKNSNATQLSKDTLNEKASMRSFGTSLTVDSKKDTIKLSKSSKFFIVIRVIILFLTCIYIPMESIFSSTLFKMEKVVVSPIVNDAFYGEVEINAFFKFLNKSLILVIGDKDALMLYNAIIYTILHPFIGIKVSIVTHVLYFFLAIMRCLYKSNRPFWGERVNTGTCHISYSNPSLHYFYLCFYYSYLFLAIRFFRKSPLLSVSKKVLAYFILVLISTIFGFALLVSKLNFIYQLNFAWTIAFIVLCFLVDLDNNLHNFVLNSMKNMYRIRKNKLRVLLFVIGASVSAIILYNFIDDDNLIQTVGILMDNKACAEAHVDLHHLGLKSTFLDTSYLFGIIGMYWGASLTVERNCGKWWEGKWRNLLSKVFMVILVGVIFLVLPSKLKFI
jgi:hypothetical protein